MVLASASPDAFTVRFSPRLYLPSSEIPPLFLFCVLSPLTVRLPSSPELLSPSCFLPGFALNYRFARRSLFLHASVMLSTYIILSHSGILIGLTFLVSTFSGRSKVRHTPECVTCSHPASSDSSYCHCSLCLHDNFFGRCHSYFSSANLAQAVSGKYLSVPL